MAEENKKEDKILSSIKTALSNKNTKLLAKYVSYIDHDEDGYYYENNDDERIPLEFEDIKSQIKKAKAYTRQDRYSNRNYETQFNNFGQIAVMRGTIKMLGLEKKPEELLKNINEINYDDVYDIAFEDNSEILKNPGDLKGKPLSYVMDLCAKAAAAESIKEKDEDAYQQLVKDGEYTDEIKTNAMTKNKYNSVKNELRESFEGGVAKARESLDKGESFTEPYTNKKLEMGDGKIKKALKTAAGNAATKVGDILGIAENNPDFFSKLVFLSIGGGKVLWKKYQQKKALERFNAYKKTTVKNLKKKVDEAIKKAKPLIKKANAGTTSNLEHGADNGNSETRKPRQDTAA